MHRLDALLEERSARALLVIADSPRDPYLLPFVGPARLTRSFVIVPRGSAPRLGILSPMESQEAALSGLRMLSAEDLDVQRWARGGTRFEKLLADVLAQAFHLCEMAPGPVALAGRIDAGLTLEVTRQLGQEGWSFVAGEDVVKALRKKKSADDVAEIRRVGRGLVAAFGRVATLLAAAEERYGELWLEGERLRVARLQGEIMRTLSDHGLASEDAMCAAGREGAAAHTHGTPERVLVAGESIVVDVFPRGRLFADCTRTFCVGTPPPALAEAHAVVIQALELARATARPGVQGWTLQQTVCEHIHLAGYPTPITHPGTSRGYIHGLGHGVGLEVHELPSFQESASGSEGLLEEGDVFALEPGLYDPDAGWAVRLEDTHHLGSAGAEILTPLQYELDPRAWTTKDFAGLL